MITYIKTLTTGPAIDLYWTNSAGTLIDFSTGYTFAAKVMKASTPTVLALTKTAGITGYTGSLGYNVRIDWETADFTPLTADGSAYIVRLIATPSGSDPFEFPSPIAFKLDAAPA